METERQGQRAATRGTPRGGAGFSTTGSNREVKVKATTRAERATSCVGAKMGSSKGKQLTAKTANHKACLYGCAVFGDEGFERNCRRLHDHMERQFRGQAEKSFDGNFSSA